MRVAVTVANAVRGTRDDAVLDAPPDAAIGELLHELGELAGADDRASSTVDGVRLSPNEPLASGRLRDGAVVTFGSPADCPPDKGAGNRPGRTCVALHVVGGPDAGTAHPLAFGTTTIGRSAGCDVVIDDPDISRLHAVFQVTADGVVIRDAGSTNGTVIDGSAIRREPAAITTGQRIRLGESTLMLAGPDEPPAPVRASLGGWSYNRPPRLDTPDPAAPRPTVEFPPRPVDRPRARLPLIATVAPLVAGVVLAAVMRRPEYLLFTVLSPVMVAAQWLADRLGHRRAERAERTAYATALAQVEQELSDRLATESAERHRRAPDLAQVLKIARGPTSRLWERRRGDPDFLQLRLGTGRVRASVQLSGPAPSHPPELDDAPVTIDLQDVGVFGIAATPDRRSAVARALVCQLAVLHSPRDLGLVLLTEPEGADEWAWIRWLPHLRPAPTAACQLLVGLTPQTTASRVAELTSLIDARESAGQRSRATHRAVVVIVDGARSLRRTAALADVLGRGPAVGVHAICLDAEAAALPEECSGVATATSALGTRFAVRTSRQQAAIDTLADAASHRWAERVARALAPLRDDSPGAQADGLPDAVRWLDLVEHADELTPELLERWVARTGGSTRAVLGAGTDGTFVVDLARDGPHALVAGTTGSGKSELLQTLVASLAVANRPDELTFVLVDYKGGAAFGSCAQLPHTVGLVTDLDGALVERALVSLSAELKRREALLAALGATDITAYRTAGGALARLVIVVDEFASLAEELPEFVGGLVGIAQRGRSLGVHLVLATQRPEGVVSADIRANTNLRICLGVMRESDSRDVIDAPDAARISRSTPGRGFARTGHGELHAFQAGRVGGPARAGSRDDLSVRLSPFRSLGEPPSQRGQSTVAESSKTDLDLLVAACREAALRLHVEAPPSPWLPPLPDVVVADPRAEHSLAAVIGVRDLPASQSREHYVFDLAVAGHLLVSGSPRSGRTTLLRTLAGSLARSTSTADVHVYALDCGGGSLAPLAALPHCGAVVAAHDPERAARLTSVLTGELTRRQSLFAQVGVGSLTEHRAVTETALPHILVMVDGWEAMTTAFEDHDAGSIIDATFRLLREGAPVGIHVVATTDRAGLVGRVASTVDERIVLRLADRSDYALIGIPARAAPAAMPPGRGYCAGDLAALQVCTLDGDPSARGQLAALDSIAGSASERDVLLARADRPRRIDPLPQRISLRDLEASLSPAANGPAPTLDIKHAPAVLGVGGDEAEPIVIDLLTHAPAFVVAGPARSGRSTALATLAANLRVAGRRVVLIAPRPSLARDFADDVLPPDDPRLHTILGDAAQPLAVLVDDAELVADSPAAMLLDAFIRGARDAGHLMVLAGTNEELSVGFRGFIVDARRNRAGLLLQPRGPLDGDVLGVRLPRNASPAAVPGRGLLVEGSRAVTLQVATPD